MEARFFTRTTEGYIGMNEKSRLEAFHEKHKNCPICSSENFEFLKKDGELLVARQDLREISSKEIMESSIILGGINFLKAFRLCGHCGFVAEFNVTMCGEDPARQRKS